MLFRSGSAVTSIVRTIHIDRLAERFGLTQMGQRIGRPISISGVLGWLVKWFILVITFVAAANALNLQQVSNFLYTQAIPYFGNVVLAAIILIIGILAANFLFEIVRDALKASKFPAADAVASVSRWAILIFSGIAALSQLKIATFFMQYLFVAIVSMIALAGGLAFGLGGRDQARDLLGSMRKPKQQ